MPRKYTKIKELEQEVFRLKAEEKTNREIAEHACHAAHNKIRTRVEHYSNTEK